MNESMTNPPVAKRNENFQTKTGKNTRQHMTNMDFDDDSLDDLLRDTSKFKKPVVNVVADELFTNSNPQSSRREKKSALLAELFGPSSATSFSAIGSSLEDQGKAAENLGSTHNLSTNSVSEDKKTDDISFGSYVPSSAARSGGTKSRPTSSGSVSHQQNLYQPSSFNLEKRHGIEDLLLPDGSPKQSIEFAVKIPVQVPELRVDDSDWKSPLPASSVSPLLLAKPIPKANVAQIANEQLPEAAGVLPFTFQLPTNQPVSKEAVDERNMAIIKEVLDHFSNNFCKKLDTLTGKNENLTDISGRLVELQKCISTASHSWLNTINTVPDRAHGELEKKILILENKIEMMSQENTNLRARLEFVENQMRETRAESSRIKTDTENVVESHFKSMTDAVNNLDNKITSHSSQYKKDFGEESYSREILLHKMQQKLLEFESKLVKSSTKSGHQQEETLHLLKAEFKWLERQKKKLKNDKKELQLLQKQIQGKQQLLDEFSAVVSKIRID